MTGVQQGPLHREDVLAAFGVTEEEMAAFEGRLDATGYTEAKRQAEDDRTAYLAWAERTVARLADLNVLLRPDAATS